MSWERVTHACPLPSDPSVLAKGCGLDSVWVCDDPSYDGCGRRWRIAELRNGTVRWTPHVQSPPQPLTIHSPDVDMPDRNVALALRT